MIFCKLVTEQFFQEIRTHYPETSKDTSFLRFIMYLSFGVWRDISWGDPLPVSQYICSILEGKKVAHGYAARTYLDKMKAYLPDLSISNYIIGDHCRSIICNGLSREFLQCIANEKQRMLGAPKETLIHYRTGAKFNRTRHKAEMEFDCEAGSETITKACSVVELQQRFLDYFNGLQTNPFRSAIREHLDSTIELAKTFPFTSEAVRERNLSMLMCIKLQPKPYYFATSGSRRLFGYGSCIPYLKRELRRNLTKDWVEFDICNCHLAIVAKDWDIASLSEFFLTGQSIWTYLSGYYPNASTTGKPYLKRTLYALVYGDSKAQMRKYLVDHGMTKTQSNQFFAIPLINDVYVARNAQLAKALFKPRDCFDTELEFEPPKSKYDFKAARSILARKAQAIELKMLEPIIDYSRGRKDIFAAVLYQYDGFSAICHDKRQAKSECERLKRVLDDHILGMGYPAHVEYTINRDELI